MKHKKRGLALLLMLTLALLCGCEGTVSERPMEDISALTIEPGADAPTADTFADQTQTVTLYLLSSDGERLVPVPAEVTMRAGESLAEAALTALLAGAKLGRTDASWPMSGEGRAPTLSVSAGIATVNLPAKYRALEPQTLFAVRQAVADTLGSLSGVTSVNVLVGGREEGLDLGATTPVGTLTRGDAVNITGKCSNGWVRIQYDGHVAYVSGKYLTEQQPSSGSTPVTPSTGGSGAAAEIAEFVMSFVGYSYVYGGSKPSTGFDCSGLMYYCLTQYGYSMNRVANDQMSQGTAVSRDQLIVGDLVFFGSGGEITHVGIYIGGGRFIHAANPRKGVIISSLSESYYNARYFGANRIIFE